jgi:hypothetical protein
MQTCGNRAKAARHRAKLKATTNQGSRRASLASLGGAPHFRGTRLSRTPLA